MGGDSIDIFAAFITNIVYNMFFFHAHTQKMQNHKRKIKYNRRKWVNNSFFINFHVSNIYLG